MIYFPGEDSYLMSKAIEIYLKGKNSNLKVLDLGTGSGIQSEILLRFIPRKNILASDIDPEALSLVRKKGFQSIRSDLFKNIKQKFDLIVFNPPYLQEDKFDSQKDTSGGKLGDETIIKFLMQSKKHLKKNGKILLLLSSHTPEKRIDKEIKKLKFKSETIIEEKLFFEKIYVVIISS